MSSGMILWVYLLLFVLSVGWDVILSVLNMRHVQKHAACVPVHFRDVVDEETYRKSQHYTLVKGKFGLFSSLVSSGLVLLFVLSGWFGELDRLVGAFEFGMYTHGVLYLLLLSLVFAVVDLPFGWYSQFVIEERFGFNKMTLGLWVADMIKGTLLSVVLMVPLLLGLFWFMEVSGEYWWLYAFSFVAGFQLLLLFLYPTLIAPLFNKFQPLPEGKLRDDIFALAESIGFKTSGIFLMDGSKRSAHGNAYFTGFGGNKRIVLFDTLVGSLKEQETVAVLAHEMGHEKKHHIKKSIVLSMLLLLVGFWVLSLLLTYQPFFEAFGFQAPSYHGALVLFAFASGPVTYFLSPLGAMLSRKHEYEADRFAVDAVGASKNLVSGLLSLSKKSLSNFTPHPLYSFFHYSHPTLAERIGAMEQYEHGNVHGSSLKNEA